jgi:hypothetical protein
MLLFACSFCALGQGGKEQVTLVTVEETTTTETTTTEIEPVPCIRTNAFGLDFGLGVISRDDLPQNIFSLDFAYRYLHHYSPYWGIDFFKMNYRISTMDSTVILNMQFMAGGRGNTPTFFKCMSGYAAFRLGFGVILGFNDRTETETYRTSESYYDPDWDTYRDRYVERVRTTKENSEGVGFCYEVEVGLNITRSFFIGYAFGYQGGKEKDHGNSMKTNSHAFRLGFNLGKNTEQNTP